MADPKSDLAYRALYESLSSFSLKLNLSGSLKEILANIAPQLKYLFNYCAVRFVYYDRGSYITYLFYGIGLDVSEHNGSSLLEIERALLENGIPLHITGDAVNSGLMLDDIVCDEAMCWNFEYEKNKGILVCVASAPHNRFNKTHIPILKIICEMIFVKTRMTLLYAALDRNEKELRESHKELELNNEIISSLIKRQEKIINERTSELKEVNKQLLELIQFNAHNVREPLTRIMSIVYMFNEVSVDEFLSEFWPFIHKSVADLDSTIREVIRKAEQMAG